MALGEVIKFKGSKKEIQNRIEFKGSKKGLFINIKECGDFETIKENLSEKMESSKNFFKGAKIASINCAGLSDIEKIALQDMLISKFEVQFVEEEEKKEAFQGIQEGSTKFIRSTLRSGTKIKFNGNVVVIGDINPGGEVVANGNVIIMGSLRGVVHAGANGNRSAFVVAYNLDPMQLRIADIIAIAPEENFQKPNCPEIAIIKDHCITIEPYLNRK